LSLQESRSRSGDRPARALPLTHTKTFPPVAQRLAPSIDGVYDTIAAKEFLNSLLDEFGGAITIQALQEQLSHYSLADFASGWAREYKFFTDLITETVDDTVKGEEAEADTSDAGNHAASANEECAESSDV